MYPNNNEDNNGQDQSDATEQIIGYLMANLGMSEEQAIDTIDATELDEAPQPVQRFTVTDYGSADWVLSRIAETEADISQIHKMLDDQINALQKRAQRILLPLQNKLNFFAMHYGRQLEAWTRQEIEGKKQKSLKLLHGKVGIKAGSVSTELLATEEEIISIIECLPVYDVGHTTHAPEYDLNESLRQAIKVSKSILKTPLKKALESGWSGTVKRPDDDDNEVQIASLKKNEDSFYFEAEVPK